MAFLADLAFQNFVLCKINLLGAMSWRGALIGTAAAQSITSCQAVEHD
jgi:hypothetical protein